MENQSFSTFLSYFMVVKIQIFRKRAFFWYPFVTAMVSFLAYHTHSIRSIQVKTFLFAMQGYVIKSYKVTEKGNICSHIGHNGCWYNFFSFFFFFSRRVKKKALWNIHFGSKKWVEFHFFQHSIIYFLNFLLMLIKC